jgi:hypothetical protein
MPFEQCTPEQQTELRTFVQNAQERFSSFRDNKETMAFAGLAVYLGAVATALGSKDWPPGFAANRPWLITVAFSVLWLFVAFYLRYQLRRRRWAAFRVAGCDWLLAEWLPGSPHAMKTAKTPAECRSKPSVPEQAIDLLWPQRHVVTAIDPDKNVYPDEIEQSWLLAASRPTDALLHERIIHLAGWAAYIGVILRTWLG